MIDNYVEEAIQAGFDSAYLIYTKGGHSKSVATLSVPSGLGASMKRDAKVVGLSTTGEQIVLAALEDTAAAATSIQLVYITDNCYVGGLDEADRVLTGCK
jgi:hypothetical protein